MKKYPKAPEFERLYSEEKHLVTYNGISVEVTVGEKRISIEPVDDDSFVFRTAPSSETVEKWKNISLTLHAAAMLIKFRLDEMSKNKKTTKGGEHKNDGRNKKSKTRRA